MVRPTLIDMNPVELKYYPFMISLNKCTVSCNVLSPKISVPKETKDIYVKACCMIRNKMKLKQWQNIFHLTVNANSCNSCNSCKTCNSKQKWSDKTWQWECKNYRKCKKDYSWNPSTCICENKYLKSIVDISVTVCDEVIVVMNIVSTKKTNAIATKVTITASINCRSKKKLLVIILLLIVIIICCYYAKQKGII